MTSKLELDQMLQSHLESFKRLILMEECTRKSCYVKLKRISNRNLAKYFDRSPILSDNYFRYRLRTMTQTHNSLMTQSQKSRIVKLASILQKNAEKCINFSVSTQSQKYIKSSAIPRKRHSIDEYFSSDSSENSSSDNLLTRQQKDPIKTYSTSPIIIPFSKRHREQNNSNRHHDAKTKSRNRAIKSNTTTNKDIPRKSQTCSEETNANQTTQSSVLIAASTSSCISDEKNINDSIITSNSCSLSRIQTSQQYYNIKEQISLNKV